MNKGNISINDILARLKISALNEMQLSFLEAASPHRDVILLSATGSGKTIAFLLSVLQQLDPATGQTQALIVTPSRELAQQIEMVFKKMGAGFKVTSCYGGHLRETEENNLKEAPALIIGTPGRLSDHIRRGNISTTAIATLVLDEFDKSVELGFQDEMSFIISALPALQRRLLTSATDVMEVPAFVGLTDPVKLSFLDEGESVPQRLEIKMVRSPEKDKLNTLFKLICFLGSRPTIVFCNHREAVERTSMLLKEKGIVNMFYHGAMEQRDRDAALSKFRNGSATLLVTTDLAARGLDIPHIRYIIHYHLPDTETSFIHRNGRTARMEASGTAILILSPEEAIPSYITGEIIPIQLPETDILPEKPKWATLFIGAGKKDKVNKIDIVGFLSKKGELKKDDIGLVDVKDFFSFVAVRKTRASHVLHLVKNEKIKNKKVKIEAAK
ncbi:MAG: DEAD/DEAH box helicase [Sphingobacteriales bacterium]|nr:DEAD/DEAH box helicase [Sphingobacteriales bacterium]OJY87239.1 MAG: helicase [Sphingobacteriales bacterium 44-15]